MPTTPTHTGNAPPKMLAPNLSTYTLQSDRITRLGCALPISTYPPNMIAINTSGNRVACLVLMLPDEAINAQGVDPQETYRHEIAHCNGWPADHGGAQWQRKTVQQ